MTFALNHMAYFVLTEGLRERLSRPARIINTVFRRVPGRHLGFRRSSIGEKFRGHESL